MASGNFKIPVGPDGEIEKITIECEAKKATQVIDLMRKTGQRFDSADQLKSYISTGVIPLKMQEALAAFTAKIMPGSQPQFRPQVV